MIWKKKKFVTMKMVWSSGGSILALGNIEFHISLECLSRVRTGCLAKSSRNEES